MAEVAVAMGFFTPSKPGQLVPLKAQRRAKRRLLSAERQFRETFVMGNPGEKKYTTPTLLRQAFPSLRIEHDEIEVLKERVEELSEEVAVLREALRLMGVVTT